ncbi:MAG: amidohydrolase [Myxococcales bacterium]|nr:amidohydrolase [Myxococcales bacterium]
MTEELGGPLDTLLVNARIHTMHEAAPRAEALGIRGGRIVALGRIPDLRPLCGGETRIVDLAGRMVLPSLIDGHCHPTKGAVAELFSCHFPTSATPAEIAGALSDYRTREPDIGCVVGGRFGSGFFERHGISSPREWLDRHSGGKPVYLRDDSGHNGWANTSALRMLGLDRNSADPPGGRIVRDPKTRDPTGLLLEQADVEARSRLPDWSRDQYRTGVREMVRIANGFGITGITDADATEPLLEAYREADAAGELTLHVIASISTPYGHREEPLDYERIEALRDAYASARVDTRFVKIYEDGVPTEARTAAMLAPYRPDPSYPANFCGSLHVAEAILAKDVAELEQRGFTVKLHTAGDRAVRVALDAIEWAHARSGRSDLRHELAHAGLVEPADIHRFRELNAAADLSPYIWFPSPLIESVRRAIGDRADRYWPIRDLLDAEAPILAGSDWPAAVASMDPWVGIATMVTRRDPSGENPGSLWADQAIGLADALRIFTVEGARAARRESVTGSLAVGKSADLIVLEKDLFEMNPGEISSELLEMTWFAGEPVYEKRHS